jgi:4-aminobutyrate aminotransferase-like enzyme
MSTMSAVSAAERNLEIIEAEGLLDRAREVDAFLLAELSALQELPVLSPPLVMTEAEAREVVSAVRSVLKRLQPDGSIAPS